MKETTGDLALVLSGGGARAAYQVGVLQAIAERAPHVSFPVITGVSAGAINAAFLAAHPGSLREAVEELAEQWRSLTPDQVYRLRVRNLSGAALRWLRRSALGHSDAGQVQGLVDVEPLRRFLAGCIDMDGVEANLQAGRLRALALTATPYAVPCTTTFIQGSGEVPTWQRAKRMAVRSRLTLEHIMASAAIPILFPAVRLGGHYYSDGSLRLTAPLSPAIHLGADRILAIGMRIYSRTPAPPEREPEYPNVAEVMGLLFNTLFLDALDVDAERMDRLNRLMDRLPPEGSANGIRRVDLLLWHPSGDLGDLAEGFDTKLPWTIRTLIGAMGGRSRRAAGFLSYLLFDGAYTSQLLDLGYRDAIQGWSRFERFL